MRHRTAAVLVAAATALAGCGAQPVDLAADAAARLQEAVWSVSSAAAQGRHDAAAAALARVRSELDVAVEDGDISVQRYRAVDEALRAVEAELTAVREAVASPADDDAAAEAPVAEEPGTEVVEPVVPVDPAPPAPPAPAPQAPADEDAQQGNEGNQGNGVGPDGNRGRGGGQGGSGKGQGRSPAHAPGQSPVHPSGQRGPAGRE